MSPKKLAVTLASVAALCAILSYTGTGTLGRMRIGASAASSSRKSPPGYSSYLQVAGIEARDYDAVDKGLRRDGDAWLRGDVDLEAVRDALEDPINLDELADGEPRWTPTQTWKLRHGGASEFAQAKEHCSARHLLLMDKACKADIDVVIERQGLLEGEVVAARPRTADDATDECRAFAECSAKHAWLGRSAPLPDLAGAYYAFQAGDVRLPIHGTKSDIQAGMRAEIESLQENLTVLRRLDGGDPNIRQNIELQQDLLEQLEWLESL